MDTPVEIIVSGHLCIDLIPTMPHVTAQALTTPGRLNETGPLIISTGGSVSNTGLALHRLSAKVRMMATVGDDLIGQAIIGFLRARDPVLTELISVVQQPSSYTIVLSPEHADRTFLHCTGTNDTFGVANVDFGMFSGARIFHLGYPPLMPGMYRDDGVELHAIYEQAKATGITTSLDMALPDSNAPSGRANWEKILRRVLPYVDIFVPSIEEILYMMRREDFNRWHGAVLRHLTRPYLTELADELVEMGAAVVGFKLGDLGILLHTANAARIERMGTLSLSPQWANARLYHPAFAVNVAGTAGAGDSAYAGLLTAMLRGLSPEEALRWACAVGACCCEAPDTTSGVRSWDETATRLAAGWAVLPQRLAE